MHRVEALVMGEEDKEGSQKYIFQNRLLGKRLIAQISITSDSAGAKWDEG